MLKRFFRAGGGSVASTEPLVEIVAPDNGQRESVWVGLFVLLVILAGAMGITLRQEPAGLVADAIELTPLQAQQWVELSITLEEIAFVTHSPWPSPEVLVSLGLPIFLPTSTHEWHQPEVDCYQWRSLAQQGDFVLHLSDQSIYWHPGAVEPLTDCHLDAHWLLLDK